MFETLAVLAVIYFIGAVAGKFISTEGKMAWAWPFHAYREVRLQIVKLIAKGDK
jgi:hypothetical protein